MIAKLKVFLSIPLCLFVTVAVMPSTASAELLWPFKVGHTYKYTDGNSGTHTYVIPSEKVTFGPFEYFHLFSFDEDLYYLPDEHHGYYEEYLRSTENELYRYNPAGDDLLIDLQAPVGTKWSYEDWYTDGVVDYFYSVRTFVGLKDITVPYGTFPGAYEYLVYQCEDIVADVCVGKSDEWYEWWAPGVGWLGADNAEELFTAIIPPRIGYFSVQRRRHEDGPGVNRVVFGFAAGTDPAEGFYTYIAVPAEGLGVNPESFTLSDDQGPVAVINRRLEPWKVAYGYFNSDSDFSYDEEIHDDEFHYEDYIAAEMPGELIPGTTYHLVVTDVDCNTYEADYTFIDFVDLPIIPASSFVTEFDGAGNLSWQWDEPDLRGLGIDPIQDASIRAMLQIFNGERYIGEYYIRVPTNVSQITVPDEYLDSGNRLKMGIQLRTNNNNNRTHSNWISIPRQDADKDGISDVVDASGVPPVVVDNSGAFSNDFSDGQTYGTITDRGDQTLAITEAAQSAEGVLLAASGGTVPTSVETCDGEALLSLDAGDEIVVTCSSVIARVTSGTVEITFEATDGTVATATLDEGNELRFDPDTLTFTAPASNPDIVIVIVDGVEVSVPPGDAMVAAIDIKPGSEDNPINVKSRGVIPVAILTTATLDATMIDPLSVTFGPDGATEGHRRGHIEDVDNDGDLDLVLHFPTQETGIACGNTEASLFGQTFAGSAIRGFDSIVTLGCKYLGCK